MGYSEKIVPVGKIASNYNVDEVTKEILLAGDSAVNERFVEILKPFDIFGGDFLKSDIQDARMRNFFQEFDMIGNNMARKFSALKEHQMILFHATTTKLYRNFGHFPTSGYNYGKACINSNQIFFDILLEMSFLLNEAMSLIKDFSEMPEEPKEMNGIQIPEPPKRMEDLHDPNAIEEKALAEIEAIAREKARQNAGKYP